MNTRNTSETIQEQLFYRNWKQQQKQRKQDTETKESEAKKILVTYKSYAQ